MLSKIDFNKYDFLDLGCKKGGSISYCEKRFQQDSKEIKGLGVDIKPNYVQEAIKSGHEAIVADVLKLSINNKFRFVSALDFLEHLPSIIVAKKVLKKMSNFATDFLFIRHPSFDDIEYLASLDLKITWTDWIQHTAMMRTYDFANMFKDLGLKQYCLIYRKPIWNSSDENVVHIKAPQNSQEYSKTKIKKRIIKFEKPIFSQIDIFVALKPIEFSEWNNITKDS